MLCFYHERELLRGAPVVGCVDNLAFLSAVCKGTSSSADFGCLVHALHLHAVRLDLLMWWEHVDSDANIADGGSRVGGRDTLARSLGVKLRDVPLPPWPEDVLSAPVRLWMDMLSSMEDKSG